MKSFVQSLIGRHTGATSTVAPRIRSRFEPGGIDHGFTPDVDPVYTQTQALTDDVSAAPDDRRPASPGQIAAPVRVDAMRVDMPAAAPPPRVDAPSTVGFQPAGEPPSLYAEPGVMPGRLPSPGDAPQLPDPVAPPRSLAGPPRAREASEPAEPERALFSTVAAILPDQGPDARLSLLPPGIRRPAVAAEPAGNRRPPLERMNTVESAPVIRVTIGRVEVRATVQSAPPARTRPAPRPTMTLEDYLKQQNQTNK
jgi:hypothetical protein